MRGIVFTSFLDLVEDNFGYGMVDKIITSSDLLSGGVYTSIGTYPQSEIIQLVRQLSKFTTIPIHQILKLFGQHFFSVLAIQYGLFLTNFTSAFQLFESIQNYIHSDLKHPYLNVVLLHFETHRLDENRIEVIYKSGCKMADFVEGWIESCLRYYGEKGIIEKTNFTPSTRGSKIRFLITKK